MRRINFWLLVLFFGGAGINHFWHPTTYVNISPPYIPFPELMVKLSGIAEIVLSIMFIFKRTRKVSCMLLIVMLVAFLPVHIYMIKMNGCVTGKFCIGPLMAWLRLPIQFVLIYWIWRTYESNKNYYLGL